MYPDIGPTAERYAPAVSAIARAAVHGVKTVIHPVFDTEIATERELWRFVLRVSALVTVVAELLNVLSVVLFPGEWTFGRFALQTFVIAFTTAIPSTYFVGWTAKQLTLAKRELHVLSRTDGLTGLPNRLAFVEAMGGDRGEVLAIVDIDHFKRINDNLGHPVGDAVIAEVAQRIATVGPEFFVARVGGEEYVCLCDTRDLEGLRTRLDGIRAKLADRPLLVGTRRVPVTISIGLAARDGRSSQLFYAAADRALYAAKNAGRNRLMQDGHLEPDVADDCPRSVA